MRQRRTIVAVSLVAAAAVILAGGLLASNMGFKLNYPLRAASGTSLTGSNTIALPYNRQVGIDTAQDLFLDVTAAGTVQNIQKFLPATDSFQLYTYGSANFGLAQGEGYFVKMGTDADYIVVGSHDPAAVVQLNAAGGGSVSGSNFFAPPYHTTAATAQDLFLEIATAQNIQKFLPATDSFQLYTYGSANFALTPGEAYFVKMQTSKSYTPSHY
jgi:hypothetical protein